MAKMWEAVCLYKACSQRLHSRYYFKTFLCCVQYFTDFMCGTLCDQNYTSCEKGMQICPDAPTFGPPAL